MMDLSQQIKQVANSFTNVAPQVSQRFLERLHEPGLTRDEGTASHYCVYFLPYNTETKQIFIVHHKKSGLWLSPGGHIDKGEDFLTALNREINEELGVTNYFSQLPEPFLITITPISNPAQPCKEHLDTWFLLETDGAHFNVDPQEFHETRWIGLEEAKSIVTDKANLQAIEKILQR